MEEILEQKFKQNGYGERQVRHGNPFHKMYFTFDPIKAAIVIRQGFSSHARLFFGSPSIAERIVHLCDHRRHAPQHTPTQCFTQANSTHFSNPN